MNSLISNFLKFSTAPVIVVDRKSWVLLHWNALFFKLQDDRGELKKGLALSDIFSEKALEVIKYSVYNMNDSQEVSEQLESDASWIEIPFNHREKYEISFLVSYRDDSIAILTFNGVNFCRECDSTFFCDDFLDTYCGAKLYLSKDNIILNHNTLACSFFGEEKLEGRDIAVLGKDFSDFFSEAVDAFTKGSRRTYGRNVSRNNKTKVAYYSGKAFKVPHGSGGHADIISFFDNITTEYDLQQSIIQRDTVITMVAKAANLLLYTNENFTERVNSFLQRMGQTVDSDRVHVWQVQTLPGDSSGKRYITKLYEWVGSRISNQPIELGFNISVNDFIPTMIDSFDSGKCLNSLAKDMPPQQQKLLEAIGVISVLIAPVIIEGNLWGVVAFDDCKQERVWNDVEESILRMAGTLLAHSLKSKKAVEDSIAADERFISANEASGEALWALDGKMVVSYASERALALSGFSSSEMINVMSWKDITLIPFELEEPEEGKDFYIFRDIEHRFTNKEDKVIWARTSGKVFFDDEGKLKAIHCNTLDITEQKRLDEELFFANMAKTNANKQLAKAVATANQMAVEAHMASAVKSDFLANMSHEIRTPMNGIMGMIHLVLKTKLNDQQKLYLERAEKAAKALLRVINDILDFSKIEAGKMQLEKMPIHLDEALHDALDIISLQAKEKGLELFLSIPPDMPNEYIGDGLRLHQVLTNLVTNAVKFTSKGEITISVKLEKTEKTFNTLHFCVKDTGIGITPIQKDKLFTAFTQADSSTTRKYGGTGLGLVLCKNIVGLMKGSIWCESHVGIGSEFHFTVELESGESQSPQKAAPSVDVSKYTVLVVDDMATSLEIMQEYLYSFGFKYVALASSGKEAIERIKNFEKPFDLLIADWKMPEMDGVETIRKIKESKDLAQPHFFLLATAYDRSDLSDMVQFDGVNAIVTKPITASHLLDTLLGVLMEAPDQESFTAISQTIDHDNGKPLIGMNILLAEDNELNQMVAGELLKQAGADITIVSNGLEALAALEKDTFDVVLLDIQMPEMDGITAASHIRKNDKYSNLPLIAMTAHAMARDKEKSLACGMDEHITKPIDPEEVIATILRWGKR